MNYSVQPSIRKITMPVKNKFLLREFFFYSMIVTSLTKTGTCYLGGLSNKVQREVNLVSLGSSWATTFASQGKCSIFKRNLEVLMNQVSTLHEVTVFFVQKVIVLTATIWVGSTNRFEPPYFHVVSHKMKHDHIM